MIRQTPSARSLSCAPARVRHTNPRRRGRYQHRPSADPAQEQREARGVSMPHGSFDQRAAMPKPDSAWPTLSARSSVTTAREMAALSWMEQSVDVGGQLSLVVHSDTLVRLREDARLGGAERQSRDPGIPLLTGARRLSGGRAPTHGPHHAGRRPPAGVAQAATVARAQCHRESQGLA
jgi:hypothetical protein